MPMTITWDLQKCKEQKITLMTYRNTDLKLGAEKQFIFLDRLILTSNEAWTNTLTQCCNLQRSVFKYQVLVISITKRIRSMSMSMSMSIRFTQKYRDSRM